jgi:hypothetical protein
MHYLTGVILHKNDGEDPGEAVAMALASGRDREWDWYQIGGRWTGLLSGYNPEGDPDNHHPCQICRGTGYRNDAVLVGPCNACGGIGVRVAWPTAWKAHAGDVATVAEAVARDVQFSRLVTPDRVWHMAVAEYGDDLFFLPTEEAWRERDAAHKAAWAAECRRLLAEHPHDLLVVVDIHN